MKLKKLFIVLFFINTLFLCFVVFIINDYNQAILQLESAYKMQHKSFVLANELRQSSDDLTRVARTYIVTGKMMFKKQFQTILDIRDGLIPRPKNYNRIFWDFYTLDGSEPVFDGNAISLKTLMKEAGFEQKELDLLYDSKAKSDQLTYLETKAMNALVGIFEDKDGNYTVHKEPDPALARSIMHSDEYHKAKIMIMKPIDHFLEAFEKRTKARILEAHERVKKLETYVSFVIIALIVLVLFSFTIILSRIIDPLETLKNAMLQLAKNDMDTVIPTYKNHDEVGEMIDTMTIFKDNAMKLIESEQKNKSLLDLAAEGIFGLDAKGRIEFINPMGCSLLGYEHQETLIGKYLYEMTDSEKMNQKSTYTQRMMLEKIADMQFATKEGVFFPIDYVSTPMLNKKGYIEGAVVVFSDITERKRYEETLKKATEEAKAANHSKSVFLANMSHELRTPLNAILGFATLLCQSSHLRAVEKENAMIIENSGKHLLELINEILELSKIEAGKIYIKPTTFDFYQSIATIQQMFQSRCEDKGLAFQIELDPSVPRWIICDEQRLRQIIINLLGNAVKFTEDGSILLHVNFSQNQLKIFVRDTGIGIDEKYTKSIFKPFEQIESDKYSKSGTGLGLAITKELVERMGGSIELESTFGKGSTFRFWVDGEIPLEEPTLHVKEQPIQALISDTQKTILIVDDMPQNRFLIRQILEPFSFNLLEASDGLEAIEQATLHSVDLIFMDILMPKLDGLEATKRLKVSAVTKHIPIIIVSAHVFSEDKQEALSVGAHDFLQKPIDEYALVTKLANALHLTVVYASQESKPLHVNEDVQPSLDPLLLKQFVDASMRLDGEMIQTLLAQHTLSEEFTQKIQEALERFDFGKIAKICQ
ncbi:Autoinducer 2 sensor kinase/phosphatase LuxQ [Sulfurospirillum diekertiae]|uniref:histidine kinase n=1 Tax=Sulfurospirillum diekertiae TaxID=1854492 RepID=A0A290HY75_9BACT|nr:response regulator [Sulfurospirillum diekertiae]ATB70610.1 Autoinducer 2 sensor kinase/phosphatase LuxQ [Sulfurospirillum diekertiae]